MASGINLGAEECPLWILGVPSRDAAAALATEFPIACVVDRPDRLTNFDPSRLPAGWRTISLDRIEAESAPPALVIDVDPGREWSRSERSILKRTIARSVGGVVTAAIDEFSGPVLAERPPGSGSEVDLRALRLAFSTWGAAGELFFRRPMSPAPTLRARFAPPVEQRVRHWWSITRSLSIPAATEPPVVIATPVHNGAEHLEEALVSIRDQLYANFRWLIFDDASSDESPEIIARVVGEDPRVRVVRSDNRLGLQSAWRTSFERAVDFVREETGGPPRYFAWTSDHDIWNADWLRTLVPILEGNRSAVLAHSWVESIDEAGRLQPAPVPIFETDRLRSVQRRLVHSIRAMNGAGNAVYGLFRVESLVQCGVFRPVLMPDRLLLTELALEGRVIQHPQVLWLRRETGKFSLRRQRVRLFRDGGRPWYLLLPWWLVHGAILGRQLRRGGAGWIASWGIAARFTVVQGLKACKQTLIGLVGRGRRD